MKILIWIVCFFTNALIIALIKDSGIMLGGIPTALMFGGTLWLARTLCKKWDEHKLNNSIKENITVQDSPIEEVNNAKVCFCRKCGAPIDNDSRFCRKCGTEIKEEQQ